MITFSAAAIESPEDLRDVKCLSIDYASAITAAKEHATGNPLVSEVSCPLLPQWVILMKPAEDIVIPITACTIHFNAFKIAIREATFGVDMQAFE